MKKLISCEFNMETVCVELKYSDGSTIFIDTIAVDNEVADNIYEQAELDYLLYNAPLEYANLVLYGDPKAYLKKVTKYSPQDIIFDKSKKFSMEIIKLCNYLRNEKRELVLSKELLQRGTSICVNVSHALIADSKHTFMEKMNAASKDSIETKGLLDMLYEGNYLSKEKYNEACADLSTLQKLISILIKTLND